jgi:hypothetical protein
MRSGGVFARRDLVRHERDGEGEGEKKVRDDGISQSE